MLHRGVEYKKERFWHIFEKDRSFYHPNQMFEGSNIFGGCFYEINSEKFRHKIIYVEFGVRIIL
jgi:hypothetical protein